MASCIDPNADANASFTKPELNANPCEFSLQLPKFSFGFVLPNLAFPPPLPKFNFSFKLSCDLANPISVAGGIEFGGGRLACFDPDPTLEDS